MDRPRMTLLRAAGAVLLLLGLAGCAPASELRVVSPQPGDGVTINTAAGDAVVDITSDKGIGKAEFELTGAAPRSLTFNLHLKGLEEFQLAWAHTRVTGHYPSAGGAVREDASRAGAPAETIDAGSPYWTPVAIEGGDQTIPLTDGYFVLTAPPALLQARPARFTLQWIDFYR